MRINLELHTHTQYSHDSMLNKWSYLLMLKLKNINAIGITDHNEIIGAIKFKSFLEKHNIKVIIGEEIFSNSGEIIGLFLKEKIEPGLSPRKTMLAIKKQGGLVYIPHPYDEKRYKTVLPEEEISKNIDLIDIIEVHNGRNIKEHFSEEQFKIANRYPTIKSVGSDAHTFLELGRNYNQLKDFNSKDEFLQNLKEAVFITSSCKNVFHQITKVVRLIKLIRKGQLNELYRVIYRRYNRKKSRVGQNG
ncbi:PHP domain-containing protein [Rossellomorea sp. AcN35-11]|nr:PHP domain-containing protein [Rossellomorea aquimaris]WJV30818.1 PHP domain-containing protein [Rossellomorea sp. AcN35-11]